MTKPKEAVEQARGAVTVISTEGGEAKTVNSDLDPGGSYAVDKTFSEVSAADFDGLVVPGGCVGADKLRGNDDAIAFIRAFFEQAKPVAAICHAPWTQVEAGVLKGRTLMRARPQVYRALSDFRHPENGITAESTSRIEDIPV